MLDDITMPTIAITGGFTLLFVLVCILIVRARGIARRRRVLLGARRTSFHIVVIDPRIALQGRAAFEEVSQVRDDQLVVVVPPRATDYTSIGYPPRPAPAPPPPRPNMHVRYLAPRQRMARGSTPAISSAPGTHQHSQTMVRPAQPIDWDVPGAPSVTARMRMYRR